jgi:hypothetical protein
MIPPGTTREKSQKSGSAGLEQTARASQDLRHLTAGTDFNCVRVILLDRLDPLLGPSFLFVAKNVVTSIQQLTS